MNAPDPPTRSYSTNAYHMVRTAQQIHVSLSQMADQKASILMGASFVIFTITVGQAKGGGAPVPLLMLGGFAFFAAVFAVLAILPATRRQTSGPINLLFFGSFTRLGEEEFVDAILERMYSDEEVFATMARDMYQNGLVLERKKYRLLGHAYRIFLTGLTLSFLTFLYDVGAHWAR